MYLDSGFKTRLKSAMEARDPPTNQSELARYVKVTPQAVQQWVSGHTALPKRGKLPLAAAFLHVRPDWLAFGQGPMRTADAATKTSQACSASSEASQLVSERERALLEALRRWVLSAVRE